MKASHPDYSHTMRRELTNPRRKSDAEHSPVQIARKKRLTAFHEQQRQHQLEFCSAFHAALPRELRDMVYDHIVTPHKRHYVVEARDAFSDGTREIRHSFFDAQSSMPEDPGMRREVWKFVEYTGEAVAKEIAEHWYRTGRFVLDAEDCLLNKFLTTDVWRRGIVPAEVVHHLRITLNPIPYIVPTDSMEADLENFSAISNKNSVVIFQIDKENYYYRSRGSGTLCGYLPYMLALIAPFVYRLRTEGFGRIKVYQGMPLSHRNHCPWIGCPREITHFFDMEQEEFQTVFRRGLESDGENNKRITDVISRCRSAG